MSNHPDDKISPEYVDSMRDIAAFLDGIFNGSKRGIDRKTGFVLLVFPFGEAGERGRCNYISNGSDRKEIAVLMKEMVARFEGQPEMKGRA